jgi:hypothetical protein
MRDRNQTKHMNNLTITLTEKQAEILYWALNSSRTKWAHDIVDRTRQAKKEDEITKSWKEELQTLVEVQSLIPDSFIKI